MPLPRLDSAGASGGLPKLDATAASPTDESGVNLPAVGAGVAGIAGLAALAMHKPAMAAKLARGLNTLRQQLMLSGFALPKSLLGNAGAALESSLERGTTAPLREMFSGQTVSDAVSAWKAGAPGGAAQAGQAPTGGNALTRMLSYLSPGRAMGAADEAAQKALVRSGLTQKEATSVAMQAPLDPRLSEALDNPVARYVHPFRRQPFNQFLEGWGKFGKTAPTNMYTNPGTMALYTGAGAVHGAATADDAAPMSLPLAVAASARYGLPYAAAALIGRTLAEGKGGGNIASSALPVSEYGFESSMSDPTRPFRKPAAITALDRLLGP